MPGLIRAVGRTAVVAGTATAVSNRVSRRQAGRWADQEQQQQYEQQQAYQQQQAYAPPPQAAAAPADDGADRLEQLKQLGELKAQGVLTEAEFQAEKNKILNA
jgi:Short C-terminal domain